MRSPSSVGIAPAILFCKHSSWSDSLLLIGSQRRCISFLNEFPKKNNPLKSFIQSFLKTISIPKNTPIYSDPQSIEKIRSMPAAASHDEIHD